MMLGMLDDVHLIDLNSLEGTEADWLIDSKVRWLIFFGSMAYFASKDYLQIYLL